MNTPDITKLLVNVGSLFIAMLIGSAIGCLLNRRPTDIERIRRQLGRKLDRFADVSPEQLDPALLTAAQSMQRGWSVCAVILARALAMAGALFLSEFYRALFPELPRWHSITICAVAAGFLIWALQGIERGRILHRLELRLHNHPPRG